MLAAIAEAILQIVAELLWEVLGEIFGEVIIIGFERAKESTVLSPVVGVLTYALFGAFFGWLNALVVADHFIRNSGVRSANLFLSPIILGITLCLISWLMRGRKAGQSWFRLDRFIAGVVFALLYSTVRFWTLS